MRTEPCIKRFFLFLILQSFLIYSKAMHIVAISGSLKRASCNTGLLRALKNALPAPHTMEIIVPGDLPLFNQDLEQPDLVPEPVKVFRNKLKTADAFLFAMPEYNYSVTGAAKNAIDWGSRGADGGNLFNDKPAAVVAAGGGVGGLRSAAHFRDMSLFLNMHVMNKPEFLVKIFTQPSPFNLETGDLIGEDDLARCEKVIEGLLEWTERISGKK